MSRQVEEGYLASQGQFNDQLQRDLRQQQFQVSLQREITRNLDNNPELAVNLPVPLYKPSRTARAHGRRYVQNPELLRRAWEKVSGIVVGMLLDDLGRKRWIDELRRRYLRTSFSDESCQQVDPSFDC